MKKQTLLFTFLLGTQLLLAQRVFQDENYSFHQFNLLDDIELVLEAFGRDSVVIHATDNKNFTFQFQSNKTNRLYFYSDVGRMISTAAHGKEGIRLSLLNDTLLIIENSKEIEDVYPLFDQFVEDSIGFDGYYVYPSSKSSFAENSILYDLKNSVELFSGKHRIYGSKIIGSKDIQFDELYEDSANQLHRVVYNWNIATHQIDSLGTMPYKDMGVHCGLVSTGIGGTVYNYMPDDIFWDNLNGVDIKKKYFYLYPDEIGNELNFSINCLF